MSVFIFFSSEETDCWLQITFHWWYNLNFLKTFAELLQDVSLFLWQLSFFCYAHMYHFVIDDLFCPNLLLAIEICRKNEKKLELSGANLENATFANLLSSRVSTSFALNLLLWVFTFLQHICSEQILFLQIHFFVQC